MRMWSGRFVILLCSPCCEEVDDGIYPTSLAVTVTVTHGDGDGDGDGDGGFPIMMI